jgi:ribosomal protein S18 acetylase RimI-like enzyme
MIRRAEAWDAPQLLSLMQGCNCGRGLWHAVIEHARSLNARLVRWQVLPDNPAAKRFYRQQGAAMDGGWENWFINLDG